MISVKGKRNRKDSKDLSDLVIGNPEWKRLKGVLSSRERTCPPQLKRYCQLERVSDRREIGEMEISSL